MSFSNGASARLDGNSSQILTDSTAKSNVQTGRDFLKAVTNLVKVILEGKVSFEIRPYFFGAKLIALKKRLMKDFVLSLQAIPSAGYPQSVPDTMSSNQVRKDTEVNK